MSNADIDSIMALAGELEQAGYSVCLNLIGGEPTKDLQQFSRILNCFSNHSACGRVNFEMTTNGWFLRSWESLCKFAAAAGQFIREREMSIRISNTEYHDPFRSYVEKRLMFEDTKLRDYGGGERKVSRLESALECPFDHYEFQAACPECEAALSGMVCSKCGLELSEDDYAEAQDKGCAAPGHEWIAELLKAAKEGRFYVDRRSPGEAKISPVGRAAKNGIGTGMRVLGRPRHLYHRTRRRFAGRLLHRGPRPDRERPRRRLATLRARLTLYPGDQAALPGEDIGALSKMLRLRSRMGSAEQGEPAQPDPER